MRRFPTLDQIREKVEEATGRSISISMLNKDFASMRNIYGAPILYDRYQRGYRYTEEGFSIKDFPLTEEEIEALDFSTALLNQLKGSSLLEQYESAINKIIEGYRISKIIGKPGTGILQVEEPLKTEANKWLEVLLKAILNKETVLVEYQAFGKEAKLHDFSPYLLKEYRNRWYAIGYSNRPQDIINFALDRIRSIQPSASKYCSSPNFNADDYFKYSLGITQFNIGKPEKVVLSFKLREAQYLISQPLHHSQRIKEQTEAEVRFKFDLFITQELIMTVLSYGAAVRVIEPESLQERIREIATDMYGLYK